MNTKSLDAIMEALAPMLNSRLDNYIIPGLTSHLVGGVASGKVRLFGTDRTALDFITPHNHRFDFTCLVLRGVVQNTLYSEGAVTGDFWCASTIGQVCGTDGLLSYVHTRDMTPSRWTQDTQTYSAGDTYSMGYQDIHSIRFSKGSRVLFFEGPEVVKHSRMIEPWVNGKVVPTFKTEPWMFERSSAVEAM